MKKLFALIPLLCLALSASAFEVVDHDGNPAGSTVVYFDLLNNGTAVNVGSFGNTYQVAAFIDGECRATAQANVGASEATSYLSLTVPGNYGTDGADTGKEITFQVNVIADDAVYQLTSDQTVTYGDDGSYGSPSGTSLARVQLSFTPVTNVTLANITLNVGETATLADYATLTPTGAQLPLNATWSVGDQTVLSLADGVITAKAPSTAGTSYTLTMPQAAGANAATTYNGTVYVYQPATAITMNLTEITVKVGDANDLMAQLAKAYTLEPENTTDVVSWTIADNTIIEESAAAANSYNPKKAGTTTMTPVVKSFDGTVTRTLTGIAPVTVIVTQPVTGLNATTNTLTANVGDTNIAERLTALVTVAPDDATNKALSWSVDNANNNTPVLSIDNNGVITALAAGKATVTATPADGSLNSDGGPIQVVFTVTVEDPATEATFTANPLEVIINNNNGTDVSAAILGNITLNGTSPKAGTIGVTSDNSALTAENTYVSDNGVGGTFTAYKEGTATVTVTLQWTDYSTGTATAKEQVYSFTVNVVEQIPLASFDVVVTPDATNPTQGTITLTPNPANATITATDYSINVNSNYGSWTAANITQTSTNPITYSYVGLLPGNYSFSVTTTDATGATTTVTANGTTTLDIPYVVNLAAGWQWKSNPYGSATDATALNSLLGGTNLTEARTQSDLLYDDSAWGYVGSLLSNGIAQSQMYKANMETDVTSYLRNGNIITGAGTAGLSVTLDQGWNWVGSPYFYNRELANAIEAANLPAGIVIQTKSGSAELANGKWTGDLGTINAGEGFLVYNPNANQQTLPLAIEVGAMLQADDASTARVRRSSVWSYDASRFANNMTMVAQLQGVAHVDDYTVGAFVDGECRGEGVVIDGRIFVTVHANGGEQVSFRLHNELTGDFYDVDQTFAAQTRIGSVANPVTLTSAEAVSLGIGDLVRGTADSNSATYDLQGRRVENSDASRARTRINIVRMSDGSVRKVVK